MHEAPADVVRRAFVGKHAVFPQSCWSPVLRSCAIHSAVQEVAFSNLMSRAPATVKCVSFDGNRCSAFALEAMEAPKVLAASNYLPGDSAVILWMHPLPAAVHFSCRHCAQSSSRQSCSHFWAGLVLPRHRAACGKSRRYHIVWWDGWGSCCRSPWWSGWS